MVLRTHLVWRISLFAGDVVVIALSVYLSLILRLGMGEYFATYLDPFRSFTGATTFTGLFTILVLYVTEAYDIELSRDVGKLLTRLGWALLIATVLLSVVFYWVPNYKMYRLAQIYSVLFQFALLAIWRLQFAKFILPLIPPKRVLIIGAGRSGQMLLELLKQHHQNFYQPAGFADDDPQLQGRQVLGLPVLGGALELPEIVARHKIDVLVVAVRTQHNIRPPLLRSLMALKARGHAILDVARVYKDLSGKVPILSIDDAWIVFGSAFGLVGSIWTKTSQRALDLALSAFGLLLALPLLILIAPLIKLLSSGPVLYQQVRVGLNKREFTLYKFRTMLAEAEKLSGPVWAQKDDPRVTGLGKILRRTRLDELPQLWNILKGEMSFIGPRPERPEFAAGLEKKIPYYALRFLVKPGLTGWAQVNHGYGASEDDALEKLQYELYYLQEVSLFLNLLILVRTFSTVLFHRGS